MSRTLALTGLCVAVLLATALRLAGWESWSLWLDEALQVEYGRQGLAALLRNLVADSYHPPLDYLITFAVRHLSEKDAVLRMPSLLWSLGATLLLWLRAGGLRRPRRAFATAFAFAVLPLAVHYGQEIRPYALGLFLVAAADTARTRWRESGSRSALVGYALASILAAYTLYVAVIALAAIYLVDLVEALEDRESGARSLGSALLVPALTAIAFLPWLLLVLNQTRVAVMAPAVPSLPLFAGHLTALVADRQAPSARVAAAVIVWALVLAGLATDATRERRRTLVELLTCTAGVFTVVLATGNFWAIRYAAFALLPIARAVGAGVDDLTARLPRRLAAPAFACLLVLLGGAQVPALVENARTGRSDWRRVAGYLAFQRESGRGGTILSADEWTTILLSFHGRHVTPPLPFHNFHEEPEPRLVTVREGWLVRTPHHATKPGIDDLLNATRPWAVIHAAEDVAIYRVMNGTLAPP